jgi:hypothetical protein
MTDNLVFVLYLLIWRLAVLSCGVVAIVLGYRLFMGGFAADQGSLEAGVGSNRLKISNIAPGTFFALFGSAIIATLVWISPPEVLLEPPKGTSQAIAPIANGPGGMRLRGKDVE